MIRLRDVRFAHRGRAGDGGGFTLKVAALDVAKGEQVACIGASGAGKTTLLHLVAGVCVPDAGSVVVLECDLGKLSDADRRALRLSRIGMVFQEFELLEYLSVRENILLAPRLAPVGGRTVADHARLAEELAELAGLSALLRRRPGQLSQGERQRVALCRALVMDPPLIVCDEPTGNLDPLTTMRTVQLLQARARTRDATLIVVTHNHQVLSGFDRVIDMAAIAGGSEGRP